MQAIVDFFERIKAVVQETIDEAKQYLTNAQGKLENIKHITDLWNNEINTWKENLAKRKAELQNEANKSPPCVCPRGNIIFCVAF